MKATVDDFWLMIWQQRPKAVVMVTNVIEDGKVSIIYTHNNHDNIMLKVGSNRWCSYLLLPT